MFKSILLFFSTLFSINYIKNEIRNYYVNEKLNDFKVNMYFNNSYLFNIPSQKIFEIKKEYNEEPIDYVYLFTKFIQNIIK